MTENMFQEGLYQVYVKETSRPLTHITDPAELENVRIHRWFHTVVNTRILLSGVVQILSALVCVLTTVTHACVSYDCSIAMATPVWSSLFYAAAGCLALEVRRKASRLKIIILMGLHLFSLLFGFSVLLSCSLMTTQPVALSTRQQIAGSYVAKWSSIVFNVQCLLLSVYIIFLSWRGLRRYSAPHAPAYCRISQDQDDTNELLMEQADFNL